MAANPITDEGLEAFCRRRLLDLSWWQKDLLFRLDDAALSAWAGDRKAARQARDEPTIDADKQIAVGDAKGLKAMLGSFAKRRNRAPPKPPT